MAKVLPLTSYLGTLARKGKKLPIDVPNWRQMDETYNAGKKVLNEGRELSRAEFFKITHRNKHGEVVNDAVGALIRQLEEHESQHPECSTNITGIRGDNFAQVVGAERRGRVWTYGLGAIPSEVFDTSTTRLGSRRLVVQANTSLATVVKDLSQRFNDFLSNYNQSQQAQAGTAPSQPQAPSTTSHAVQSYPEVVLMSFKNPDVEVARGLLQSQDPMTLVDGIRLGVGSSEVLVHVALEMDHDLLRPYGAVRTIMDAIGSSVAWPSSLVKFVQST
ncbi:uncharacterized protein LOC143891658 [Tasmannia lanceolata]|uniref:uncharacterized protein LOC143891658 n=1 Tax=Tasmannia lanceolata TaxID=3420 RepID=UPI00406281A1